MNDKDFDAFGRAKEKVAWHCFKSVVISSLGNNKANNFKNLIDAMLTSYHKMGCNISLKMDCFGSFSKQDWSCNWGAWQAFLTPLQLCESGLGKIRCEHAGC